MTGIKKHKRNLRVAILLLLVLAFTGPWAFDRINVPEEFACSAPNIRLEGDYCGLPMSGVWSVVWMIGGFITIIGGIITGEIVFIQTDFSFWISIIFSLILILLILPIINILILILRKDQPRFLKFHLVICGLDLVPALLIGVSGNPRFYYVLWGIWLYLGTLVSILTLEGMILKHRKTDQAI